MAKAQVFYDFYYALKDVVSHVKILNYALNLTVMRNSLHRINVEAIFKLLVAPQTIKMYKIEFEKLRWESPMQGIRNKILSLGKNKIRLVEY